MFDDDVRARKLPPTLPSGLTAQQWAAHRSATLELFMREEYGITPPAPGEVRAERGPNEPNAWAGKAEHYPVKLSFDTPRGEFSFTADIIIPRADHPLPMFLYISFLPYPNGRYGPIEEIVDGGYAMATFCYNDVTLDKDDGFASGLAAMYPREDPATDWGKIGMWAFAASRVMDYVQTLPQIDKSRIFSVGHSRLGKTSIWCAAQDERFAAGVSNDSGCSGAAITRDKQGERVEQITNNFPYWFCGNYQKYRGREHDMPFDQHQLMALLAPRHLYVASALEDIWSDPTSEFMAAKLASDAWTLHGRTGLVNPTGDYISAGEHLHDGDVGYHMRTGLHFLSRYDWQQYMQYFDRHFPGDK